MKNRFALASIAALVGLAACSDSPVAPSATPTLTKPSFVVTESPRTPIAGQVWVCKAWDGTEGGAPQVTTVGAPERPSTLTIHNGDIANLGAGAANCVHVATSTSSNQDDVEPFTEDTVTVTEILDANTSFVSGTVFFSGGLQSPETFGTTSLTQAFNNFHGVVIVFENKVDEVPEGCTYTQGYWKTHGPSAKGNNSNEWPVNGLTLGTVAYTADQLQTIFDTAPKGNGLITLAHQLIAAKLNVANGASSGDIDQAIADADALIGGLNILGGGTLTPAQVSSLVTALTNFNEGTTGPGHCD